MLCSEILKDYIRYKNLEKSDPLFLISPQVVNRYLQRVATKVFGDGETLAGQKYSEITMYVFRHISCCYWLPRYKSESSLKYRFGWKKSDKIFYYSEMLGMKDTISEEDILDKEEKTHLQKELKQSERTNGIMQEQINSLEAQMKEIYKMVSMIVEKGKSN
jgi:hypothetical protein